MINRDDYQNEKDQHLIWKTISEETVLKTPIFNVDKMHEISDGGIEGDYLAIKAPDWIVTIPVLGDEFILVRQWRFGMGAITTEFPAGLANEGESPEETARRELEEETGYRAGKITVLGQCNPNPALFANRISVCLAEELVPTHEQHLDEDEVLDYFTRPIREVIDGFCTGEYQHAYMGTALALYMREKYSH